MDVSIRDSTPEDAAAIFDLRCDPRLSGSQYAPFVFESPMTLFDTIAPGSDIPRNGLMCSTIIVDDTFAGHIFHRYRTTSGNIQLSTLGWNVIPELWGNGVAPTAVRQLINERFKSNENIVFSTFCFPSNKRCIRVLEKLNFDECQTLWRERAGNYIMTLGRKKLLKFTLTFGDWRSATPPIDG